MIQLENGKRVPLPLLVKRLVEKKAELDSQDAKVGGQNVGRCAQGHKRAPVLPDRHRQGTGQKRGSGSGECEAIDRFAALQTEIFGDEILSGDSAEFIQEDRAGRCCYPAALSLG